MLISGALGRHCRHGAHAVGKDLLHVGFFRFAGPWVGRHADRPARAPFAGRHPGGGPVLQRLKTGSEAIGLYANVPNEIVAVIQSLIILFLAVRFLNEKYGLAERLREKLTARRALGEEGKA